MGGMMTPSTSVVMILPKAAPITTATARSTTFPRVMNSLNSLNIIVLLPGNTPQRPKQQAVKPPGRISYASKRSHLLAFDRPRHLLNGDPLAGLYAPNQGVAGGVP